MLGLLTGRKARRIRATHHRTRTISGVPSRENWQKRLWWTGISRPGRDTIVGLENDLVDHHDTAGKEFTDILLETFRERGHLSVDDIVRALGDSLDMAVLEQEDRFRGAYDALHGHARDQALKRVGLDPVRAATRRLIAQTRTKTGASSDDLVDDAFRGSFSRITSLPADVVDRLRAKLIDAGVTGIDTRQVIREMLGEFEGQLDEGTLQEALQDIWGKTRTDLQRVVRTETINAYSKAQLQEWADQGIEEVTRHAINDDKTCANCRDLARPGSNVYSVQALLALEHPVTEDPDAPGEFIAHPNCRCWFEPVLENIWAEVEEIEHLGGYMFSDIDGPMATAIDVPLDSQGAVKGVMKEIDVAEDFQFVPTVTELTEWQTTRLEELRAEDPATAEQRLADEIESGAVMHWTNPDTGMTMISDSAKNQEWATLPFARREGTVLWENDSTVRGWWEARYAEKMKEASSTLEENGVQIFGGLPFFVQAAGASAQDYFVEAYAHYMVDPVILNTLDPPGYAEMLKVFDGVEYIERGGIN